MKWLYNHIRLLWILAGLFCLALGTIGALLPVMPTAPFLIAAAYCFSKGSKKWHHWLVTNRYFGSQIVDWEQHRVIRLGAKIYATVAIVGGFGTSIVLVDLHFWIKVHLVLIALAILVFIWTKPSR